MTVKWSLTRAPATSARNWTRAAWCRVPMPGSARSALKTGSSQTTVPVVPARPAPSRGSELCGRRARFTLHRTTQFPVVHTSHRSTVMSNITTRDDTQVDNKEWGEGGAPDTIVLIHGFWVTPRSWERWIPYYEAKGYRVLAPAYPGLED